jgi:hypothetical protein
MSFAAWSRNVFTSAGLSASRAAFEGSGAFQTLSGANSGVGVATGVGPGVAMGVGAGVATGVGAGVRTGVGVGGGDENGVGVRTGRSVGAGFPVEGGVVIGTGAPGPAVAPRLGTMRSEAIARRARTSRASSTTNRLLTVAVREPTKSVAVRARADRDTRIRNAPRRGVTSRRTEAPGHRSPSAPDLDLDSDTRLRMKRIRGPVVRAFLSLSDTVTSGEGSKW